jgi:hypothetical protein
MKNSFSTLAKTNPTDASIESTRLAKSLYSATLTSCAVAPLSSSSSF